MKRHALALILHPYKNRLISRAALQKSIDSFAENVLNLCAAHPHLRLNIALPAYTLECVDPLLLSQLRDLSKRNILEWIITGYTEPFLSFSPQWLTIENIRYGTQVFQELTGEKPVGFLPPFSNWEPSYIEPLRGCGISYSVLSGSLLPHDAQPLCGYWMTEHSGSSMALFFTYPLHHYTVPADFVDWLTTIYNKDESDPPQKIIAVEYLLPLDNQGANDPYKWLGQAAYALDKTILNFQPVCMQEQLGSSPSLGLQFIPPSLPLVQKDSPTYRYFLNQLLLYDQVGLLQRKLMETCDQVQTIKEARYSTALKKQLFFIQDVNRYLPQKQSGFGCSEDRLWTYGKLIDIDRDIHQHNNIRGGQIRIADFLRNGNKSVIMSNKSMKAYIDYGNGGHIFEFDYRDRSFNLCAAYNPQALPKPNIVSPGNSRTSFADRLLPEDTKAPDIIAGSAKELGNFLYGQYDYKVKKSPTGVKILLSRQGSILKNDRSCPLGMEKVFGLEEDNASFSFVYQFNNHSLTNYSFRFAIECTFVFPGIMSGQTRLIHQRQTYSNIGREYTSLESAVKWMIEDRKIGVLALFITQKPVDVWFLPSVRAEKEPDPSNGVTFLISSPVQLDQSSTWKLMGKIVLKKIRAKDKSIDEI